MIRKIVDLNLSKVKMFAICVKHKCLNVETMSREHVHKDIHEAWAQRNSTLD